MPLVVPIGDRLSVSIQFGRPRYAAGEPIDFQVVVTGTPVESTVTVTGSVTVTGQVVPVTGTVPVDQVQFGPFAAPGYDVVQDAEDPSRFVAVPQ